MCTNIWFVSGFPSELKFSNQISRDEHHLNSLPLRYTLLQCLQKRQHCSYETTLSLLPDYSEDQDQCLVSAITITFYSGIKNYSEFVWLVKIVLKDGAVDTMCFLRLSMLLICKFSLHNPFRCKYRCCLYISFSNLDLPAYWTSWVVHCYSLGMMFFLLAITQELYILLPYILSLNQDVTKSSYHPGTFHICLKLWLFLSPFAKSFLDCYSSLLHLKLTNSSQISGCLIYTHICSQILGSQMVF